MATALHSLKDLLVDELKDLYDAEQQLLKALPKMAKAATNPKLEQGFTEHHQETQEHVARLERVFSQLEIPARRKTCHAMKGLLEEGEEAIERKAPGAVRDANLIGAAQRVEHYEIAAYGTARAFAEVLGEEQVANLLQITLDEEGATDKRLTLLAQTVNEEACAVDQESESAKR